MIKYISLIRGINVGGRNIKSTDLKKCYENVGLTGIKSYLQSGNITFSSEETSLDLIKTKLEQAVSKKFNFPAKIFVLSKDELKSILEKYPFDKSDKSFQYYIIFTEGILAASLYAKGKDLKSPQEDLALGHNVVYWKVLKGTTVSSPFSKLLVKTEFKDFHTNRNINTLIKLLS